MDNLCWTVFIPIFPAFFRPQYGFLSVGILFSMKPLAQLFMNSLAMTAVDNLGRYVYICLSFDHLMILSLTICNIIL